MSFRQACREYVAAFLFCFQKYGLFQSGLFRTRRNTDVSLSQLTEKEKQEVRKKRVRNE